MKTKLMALAALQYARRFMRPTECDIEYVDKQIAAIKAAIETPAEPVQWQVCRGGVWEWCKDDELAFYKSCNLDVRPLYTTPQEPAAKPFDDSALYRAAISCGHLIEHHSITLERDETKPGNALNQLQKRLNQAALEMALQEPAAPGCAGMIAVNKELLEALREIVGQHGQWNNGIWAANIASTAIAKATRATP